jgi:putative transposase
LSAGEPACPTRCRARPPRSCARRSREAFFWAERRTVTKTATVSLHGNAYQVDELLIGRKVELVFDPFDLADIEVRCDGRTFGMAVAVRIGRHAHPKARSEATAEDPAPAPTGVDYLRLLEVAHTQQLHSRINYAALIRTDPTATPTSIDHEASPA